LAPDIFNKASLVLQRRAIGPSNEREKLMQFTVGINGQPSAPQIGESDRVLDDYWREENAHISA
jgi:hypothetical protein